MAEKLTWEIERPETIMGRCCWGKYTRAWRHSSGAAWSEETNIILLLFVICTAAVSYSLCEMWYHRTSSSPPVIILSL